MHEWLSWLGSFLRYEAAGVQVWRFAVSFAILVASLWAKIIVSRIIGIYIKKLIARTRFHIDDVLVEALRTPLSWAATALGVWVALTVPLGLMTGAYSSLISRAFSAIVAFLVMVFLLRLIDGLAEYLTPKVHKTETSLDDAVIPAMKTAAKILVVIVAIIWVLNKWEQPVSSILAGLGVGGLAVALAAQGTLSNWFGAFMIFSDRPFGAGDRVIIDTYDGFVEQVGLRSTRLRLLDGTIVTIPNATVANAHINNISRMPARKSNYTIGVTYDTSAEKVEEALSILKDVLETNDRVRKDYVVRFEAFGAFSLNIRVIFWGLTVDYYEWLAISESVNLETLRRFNGAGIEFAFPTQTIYVKRDD